MANYCYAASFDSEYVRLKEWAEAARNAKLRKIELSCGSTESSTYAGEIVPVLLGMMERGEIEIPSVHIPFYPFPEFSIAHADETERRKGVAYVLDWLADYKVIGAKNYTLHGSIEPISDDIRPKMIQSLRRSLQELLPHFAELGAWLNVETLPRTCLGRDAEEMLEILDGLPEENLGVCVDVNHICGCPENVPGMIRALAPRVHSLHISDYDGIDECHWYPGMGVLDWRAIMQEIKALPNDVVLIQECMDFVRVPGERMDAFAVKFRNASYNAFFLENAEELMKRRDEYSPR